jgi:hypothetical protein
LGYPLHANSQAVVSDIVRIIITIIRLEEEEEEEEEEPGRTRHGVGSLKIRTTLGVKYMQKHKSFNLI